MLHLLLLIVACSARMSIAASHPTNIVTAARLSSAPELPTSTLHRLIDAGARSGIAFPVGSKGDGAFTFTFLRPHTVQGMRFHQTSAIYYTTRFKVTADKDGDGKFETSLAEADAAAPPGWTSAQWAGATVHALRLASVAGVSKGRRAHPCLSEIEVLGLPLPTDTADARTVGNPVTNITQVRKLSTWIDLSGRTRPVAVLRPKGEAYERAGLAICRAIEAKGGQRPTIETDPSRALPERFNVVALGNINNNQLIARLYWNHYAYEDSLLPGPGAYSLRTVYDPYPWHDKGDVVVVGISEPSSATRAAEALVAELGAGDTPVGCAYRLVISSAKPLSAAEARSLNAKRAPSFRLFYESASPYLKTGKEAYARHAIKTLDRIVELYRKNPDQDCDWPEETISDRIMATWDAFEECPFLREQQRAEHTVAFLRLMRRLPKHVSGYAGLGKNDLVSWNHTTFPLMGLYFGARHFQDYYGLSETEKHLQKVHACMSAQAKSYKPQEDADSYLIITMRHAIDYCLAEWRLDLLESGVVRDHADYVIGICDSAGLPSGFGDSGIGVAPRLVSAVLPRAFWWTRDPGYLWVLQHVHGTAWPNPFHRDVQPKEPASHVGMRVFPLDRQLYEYTRLRSYYNEPTCPPSFPLEATFDKISFRESWDKKAQYLLLDGFSRGKHLHYDGNAIIEYVDHGRRWLIDHDYLTRNTTEHNMLSVLRNGRADRLMPSCAGLRCAADVGGRVGLVSTELRDYLGIDWRRYIFWRKGEFFVVMDRMTARQAGDYDLDLVWKVEDRGEEMLNQERGDPSFVVRRAPVFGRTRRVRTIRDANASGGHAVLLGEKSSSLSLVVDLPEGEYGLAIRAYGLDGSSDSLFASTIGSHQVPCHVPQLRYGPSNTKYDHSGRAPRAKLLSKGRQVVTLFLRENPPVRIDKIVFLKSDGEPAAVVEAEEAVQPTAKDLVGLDAEQFHIKWPDNVSTRTTATTPPGIVVPVRKLWQRWSGKLEAGACAEEANLLYVDRTTAPADWRIRRIGPGAVLIEGREQAVLAAQGAKVSGLSFDAEMVCVSASAVAWSKGRSVVVGEGRAESRALCDAEIHLPTMKVLGDKSVVTTGLASGAVARWLEGVFARESASRQAVATALPPAAKPLQVRRLTSDGPVRRLRVADLDNDGVPEILVAAGRSATALSQTGDMVWSYALGGECRDLAAGELAPNPGLEVVIAGGDTYAYLLDARGTLISKHQIRGPVWSHSFGDRPWQCLTTLVRDLDCDGTNEIIVGTKNFELRVYDANWRQLARARKAVPHGSIDFHTVDANGDGQFEIVTTDRYGSVCVFGRDCKKLGHFYTSIGDMQAAVADLEGDGNLEVVCGSSTGDLICKRLPKGSSWRGRGAETVWRFDNFGYGVNRLRAADLDGDGKLEVVVASQTGYLYVLGADGEVRWQDRAGADVVEAVVLADRRLVYLDGDGVMTLATGDGKTRTRFGLKTQPNQAVQMGSTIVIGGDDGVAIVAIPGMD